MTDKTKDSAKWAVIASFLGIAIGICGVAIGQITAAAVDHNNIQQAIKANQRQDSQIRQLQQDMAGMKVNVIWIRQALADSGIKPNRKD